MCFFGISLVSPVLNSPEDIGDMLGWLCVEGVVLYKEAIAAVLIRRWPTEKYWNVSSINDRRILVFFPGLNQCHQACREGSLAVDA